ncbi:MAG: hypothetical protein KF799_07705 [Bdellovibrionales bacterium]|nr:hypothetical protein [Bdellovibrionales bacterium]
MRLLLLLLIFLPLPTFAVDNLSCAKTLSDLPVSLDENDVVWRGRLYAHWETGMEDQIGWSVTDDQLRDLMPPDVWLWTRPLREGDRIIVLDQDGKTKTWGYFHEIQGHPNMPALYRDQELSHLVMSAEELRKLFQHESAAVVIQRFSVQEKAALKSRLNPLFDRQRAHLDDPNRFVSIGNLTYERQHYETVLRGHLELKSHDHWTQAHLVHEDEREPLEWGDRLFLLNEKGRVFFETLVRGQDVTKMHYEISRAKTAVVIRASAPAMAP